MPKNGDLLPLSSTWRGVPPPEGCSSWLLADIQMDIFRLLHDNKDGYHGSETCHKKRMSSIMNNFKISPKRNRIPPGMDQTFSRQNQVFFFR
jgi:hypothetical protein